MVGVGAGGAAVEAGAEVAGAVVVAEESELSGGGMSRTWDWQEDLKSCGDKVDQAPLESTDR